MAHSNFSIYWAHALRASANYFNATCETKVISITVKLGLDVYDSPHRQNNIVTNDFIASRDAKP